MPCFFLDIDYLRISAFFRNKKQTWFHLWLQRNIEDMQSQRPKDQRAEQLIYEKCFLSI